MGTRVFAIFLDEMLFMNIKAFPSIFPVAQTGAALIMTSSISPGAASSAMCILDAKYDDGTNVVRKLDWVQSCIDCKRKGIADKCQHVIRRPEHFHGGFSNQKRVTKLLDAANPGAARREMEYIFFFVTALRLFLASKLVATRKTIRHRSLSFYPNG